MKRMIKKGHRSLLLMVTMMLTVSLFSATALAAEVTRNGFVFDTKTGMIISYTGTASEIDIPDTIDGVSVVAIADYAFEMSDLTSVSIPSSVTTIGENAFGYCWSLSAINVSPSNPSYKSVDGVLFSKDGKSLIKYPAEKAHEMYTVPSGVTSIGVYAFESCYNLTSLSIPNSVISIGDYAFSSCGIISINIPSSVKSIGDFAFEYCSYLSAINVSSSNPSYKSEDGVLLSKDGKTLIQYPSDKRGNSYTIPSGVTIIGDFAFESCYRLNNVSIPNSVTRIGEYAFADSYITSISLPSSVTSIADNSFSWCFYLSAINVSSSNPSYKSVNGVLFSKDGKTLVQYPIGRTNDTYTIPSGVSIIGNCAFDNSYYLTNVGMPGSLTSIGDAAFGGCSLKSVELPNGLKSIGLYAFYNNEDLTSMTIPSSVTTICEGAFEGCYRLVINGYNGSYAQKYAEANSIPFKVISPEILYRTHVQNAGWQDWKSNGEMSGTSGQSLRLEGIYIDVEGLDNSIEYRTHVQNIGWQDWVSEEQMSGTTGKSLRLEAIQIRLKNEAANQYDIYYRVHAQNVGWMGWAKNGQSSGTAGYSYRLEAIEIKLVAKGAAAPGSTANPFMDANPAVQPSEPDPQVNVPSTEHSVRYQTHVQNVGWQGWKRNGEVAGTSGQSLRLEGMYIQIEGVNNAIEYRTHVQNIGWQDWVRDGAMTGTSGQSLRLEAIDIRLTGDMASKYDIYYRVHAQNVGWMGWAKNGESAGTAGFSYRLEGIQIVLVDKGGAAPGSTSNAFIQN